MKAFYSVIYSLVFFASSVFALGGLTSAKANAAVPSHSELIDLISDAHAAMLERAREEAQAWLLEQPKPELRALGMIPGISAVAPLTDEASNAFLKDVSRVLSNQPNPAALHFLALACENNRLMPSCIENGLAEAVERVDPSNFATWSLVYHDQPELLLDALEQSDSFNSFQMEAINGWYRAMNSSKQPIDSMTRLTTAWSIVLAIPMPAFQNIIEPCKLAAENGPDSDLADGCRRVGKYMRDQGDSLIDQSIGYAVLAEMAKLSNADNAEQLQQQREAFQARIQCLGQAHVGFESDVELTQEYLGLLVEQGEIQAMEIMADVQGIECE